MVIRLGKLEFDGPAEEALALHHELMVAEHAEETGGLAVSILRREFLTSSGPSFHAQTGELATYSATIRFEREVASPRFHFDVFTEEGSQAYSITSAAPKDRVVFSSGDVIEVRIPIRVNLVSGTYRLRLTAYDEFARDVLAHDSEGLAIYVRGEVGRTGVADLDASIEVDGSEMSNYGSLLIGRGESVKAPPAS